MRIGLALSCLTVVLASPARRPLLHTPAFVAKVALQHGGVHQQKASDGGFSSENRFRWCKSRQHICMAKNMSLMARGGGVDPTTSTTEGVLSRVKSFANKRFFILGAFAMVSAARFAPTFGATGGFLRPELTVNKAGETT